MVFKDSGGGPGPQGETGPAGVDGATGAQGPAGATGVQGPTGPVGADGATGPMGPAGATGAGGAGGADISLSNLATLAINTSLLPGTNNSIDLGSNIKRFRNAYIETDLQLGDENESRTNSQPHVYRHGDTTCGIRWPGGAVVRIVASGSSIASFGNTALTINGTRILNASGSAGNPSYNFSASGEDGMFYTGTAVGVAATGALKVLIGSAVTLSDAVNLAVGATTGTKIGTATTQKIGFFNTTPVVQQAAVADASGGATVDTEARTALNALLAKLRALGLIAT